MKWIWISFILTLALFYSCQNSKKAQWKKYVESEVKAHVNRKFFYPDSAFSSYPESAFDSVIRADLKIVASLDIDCSTCLGKFYYWNKFFHRVDSIYGLTVPVVLYVHSETKFGEEMEKLMSSQWSYLWAHDCKYEYIDKNNLYDERFQVLVLDEGNIIRLVGNPFLNQAMEELFIKYIISKHEKEK